MSYLRRYQDRRAGGDQYVGSPQNVSFDLTKQGFASTAKTLLTTKRR